MQFSNSYLLHRLYSAPGMALGFGLTSVRGNRGVNYENEPLVRQKHIKKKNIVLVFLNRKFDPLCCM
jgi:hypothetical protein